MKKILLLLGGILAVSLQAFAALEPDLRKGIDLTATNSINTSALNQLVDNGQIVNTGSITNNKGIIMRSTVRPDVTLNPRMTNFLWLDMRGGYPGTLRQYIPTGDADTNWVAATFGVNSIDGSSIAAFSITSGKMATNSVYDAAIQDNGVRSAAIQALAVVAGKIAPSAVVAGNIAPSIITGGQIALNTISNANIYDFTISSNKIAVNGIADFNIKAGGMLGSNVIAPFSLTGTNIRNGAVTNEQLALRAVGSNNIALANINAANLDTNILALLPFCVGNYDVTITTLRGVGVSSITTGGTGKFRINFSTARAGTNYVPILTSCGAYNGSASQQVGYFSNTTASVWVAVENSAGAPAAPAAFSFSIYDFTLP